MFSMPKLSMAKLINTWRFSERGTPVYYFPLCAINFNKSHTLTLYIHGISHYPSLHSCHLFCIFFGSSQHTPALSASLYLSEYIFSLFLTSSRVVWLTEKCLILRVLLLDSSWSKMSATPPGATDTWYSTILECWSCSLGNKEWAEA